MRKKGKKKRARVIADSSSLDENTNANNFRKTSEWPELAINSEEEVIVPTIIDLASSSANSENNVPAEKPPKVEEEGISGKQPVPEEAKNLVNKSIGGQSNRKGNAPNTSIGAEESSYSTLRH